MPAGENYVTAPLADLLADRCRPRRRRAPRSARRDPADLARFLASAMALAIAAFLRVERPQSLRNLSGDLVSLAARLPDVVQVVVVGSTQLASIAAAVYLVAHIWYYRRAR